MVPACKEFDDAQLDLGKCSSFISQQTNGITGNCDERCHRVLGDFVSSCRYEREEVKEQSSVRHWLDMCVKSSE
jgi:hypothetical protein